MARPLTRTQRLENAAFLTALRRSGNARLAARECGLKYGTVHYRRGKHPAFAQRWDAALVFAQARLAKTGPLRPASPSTSPTGGGGSDKLRTAGGEPVVVLLKDGRLQMRRAQPGKVTRAAEQAFLLALSATANIRLAAASVGVAEAAFHRRKRQNPAFAREMRAALAEGYARLEEALIEGWSPASGEDAQWRRNDPPAIAPMTPAQALQLMYLHHKEVNLASSFIGGPLRPGESSELRSARLARLYRARLAEAAEDRIAAKVLGDEAARPGPHEPLPIALPDLAQVKGWSRADPTKGGREGRWGDAALFGGWRIEHLTSEQREAGRANAHGAARGRAMQVRPAPPKRKPERQLPAAERPGEAAATPASKPPASSRKRQPTPEEVERWLWGEPQGEEGER